MLVVVSVFHFLALPFSFLFFLFCGCLDLAAPLLFFSVFTAPGTIRKAQNLLKQYSQHGLDGKKGGSNLTPLEGNAPPLLFSFRSLTVTRVATHPRVTTALTPIHMLKTQIL